MPVETNATVTNLAYQCARRIIDYVRTEIERAAELTGIGPVHTQTAVRIAENVLEHGGSVHAAITAAKRYVANRAVTTLLSRHTEPEPKQFQPALWVGGVVFGAAVLVVFYEAACVMGLLP
jgi:hypothetical protein